MLLMRSSSCAAFVPLGDGLASRLHLRMAPVLCSASDESTPNLQPGSPGTRAVTRLAQVPNPYGAVLQLMQQGDLAAMLSVRSEACGAVSKMQLGKRGMTFLESG